jgi:hypothetical protein
MTEWVVKYVSETTYILDNITQICEACIVQSAYLLCLRPKLQFFFLESTIALEPKPLPYMKTKTSRKYLMSYLLFKQGYQIYKSPQNHQC